MLGCDFEIIYKKGKQNNVANALLRKEENSKCLLCIISIPQSNWVEEARIECEQDKKICKIIQHT